MSLRVVRAVGVVERSDDFHEARLLLLLRSAGGRAGTKPIAGIMKLAKMDFLLRYPSCLAKVLIATGSSKEADEIPLAERETIEAKMIRFRYGPWDDRYRRWIGLLVARGLAVTFLQGRTVFVALSERGRVVAEDLGRQEAFIDLKRRSDLVARSVGSMSATRLKDFVYEQFPELLTMRWGEEIAL